MQLFGNSINIPKMQGGSLWCEPFVRGDEKDMLKRLPADLMQTDNDTIKQKQSDKLLHPQSNELFFSKAKL